MIYKCKYLRLQPMFPVAHQRTEMTKAFQGKSHRKRNIYYHCLE